VRSTGYTDERARIHDEQIELLLIELGHLGYSPEALEVDGHRPDILLRSENAYLDVKACERNLAIELDSLMEYRHIQVNEKRRVYILHYDPSDESRYVLNLDCLRPMGGPKRPTGNGSNDDWQLFFSGRNSGTPFEDFFPPAGEPF
jgi:hypothetical protein